MAKRKAAAPIVLAEVDESKKAKQDPPPEQPAAEKSPEVAVETPEATTSAPEALDYIQIIVTGDRKCGKSCLVLSFMKQLFPPRQGEFLSKQYLHIRRNKQAVMIWDLDARSEFAAYRQQSYPEADVALLCFNVRRPDSLEEDESDLEVNLQKWLTELDKLCKDIPIFLVGLQKDLKANPSWKFYGEKQISYVRTKWPQIQYYTEVSAYLGRKEVDELFEKAINNVDTPKPKGMFANCGFEILGHNWLTN